MHQLSMLFSMWFNTVSNKVSPGLVKLLKKQQWRCWNNSMTESVSCLLIQTLWVQLRKNVCWNHLYFFKKRQMDWSKAETVPKAIHNVEWEQVSSSTFLTELAMITSIIEAKQNIDVATCDIPNAFIQTESREKTRIEIKLSWRFGAHKSI